LPSCQDFFEKNCAANNFLHPQTPGGIENARFHGTNFPETAPTRKLELI